MRELQEKQFGLNFENTSMGSFSVISISAEEKIQEFQIEQIAKNAFPGILKFDVQNKNNQVHIYYNITSKIGLEQFLSRKRLKKDEFITIIQSIGKILLKAQNFLLYDKNIVLDKKHIYIDAGNMEVFVIYMPLIIECDITQDYKNFVLDLIMKSANIDEDDSDNYMQKIINDIKSEQFNIENFVKLLNEIKLAKTLEPENSLKPTVTENIPIEKPKAVDNKVDNKSNFILFKKLFNKKEHKVQSKDVIKKDINPVKREILNIPQKIEAHQNLQADNRNNTVVLAYNPTKGASLNGIKDDCKDEVRILKHSFIIGRFRPQVDFVVQNKCVSKVHSEIINRDGSYYIKDINSQNGTFINTMKIDSNMEYEIKNGDKIAFADSEFLFVIS